MATMATMATTVVAAYTWVLATLLLFGGKISGCGGVGFSAEYDVSTK